MIAVRLLAKTRAAGGSSSGSSRGGGVAGAWARRQFLI